MNSLADIPSEYHCHRKFYRCVWGEVSCKYIAVAKQLKLRKNYEYCPDCKKKYSVKADTKVLSYCNLTFRQIIILIWCWQQKCSIGETIKIAGVSYPTVRKVASAAFRASLKPSEAILEGACEVDGQLLWQEEVRAKQRLVIGAIDPKRQRIRLRIIHRRDRENARALPCNKTSGQAA